MRTLFLLHLFLFIALPLYGQVPAFSVNKNGTNQTVSTGVLTKLTWPNEVFDTNNNFASDRFTPTVAGKYLISAAAFCVNASSGCSIWIRKNGSDLFAGYQGDATVSTGGIINGTAVVDMNGSTDYVEAFIITSGTTINGPTYHTYFTGSLLDGGGGGSGTVNSGTQYQMGYYATTGTAISGHSAITTDASSNLLVSSGSVGVGTASPGSKLDVKGTLRLSGSTSGFVGLAPAAAAGSTIYTLPAADGTSGQMLRTNGSGTLSWASPSDAGPWIVDDDRIYYLGSEVGIGTATPASTMKLDVNGYIRASHEGDGGVEIFYTGSTDAGTIRGYNLPTAEDRKLNIYGTPLLLNGDTSASVGIGTTTTTARVNIAATMGSTPALYIQTGTVGIGTASPRSDSKLDVNGTLYVGTFASSSSTTVCQNGNVLSTCSSARRYKENIKPSQLGLKEVLEMKPVTFDFKDHKDDWEKHDFGFVAEDMEKINPLFVTYDDKGKIEGVRYMQLSAITTKAIQELHAVIEKQQEKISKLEHQLKDLKVAK